MSDLPEPDPAEIVKLLQQLPRTKITPETITQHTIDKWYAREREYRAEIERLRVSRNGANAMMGVHKRRADRLRTELDHAKAALAGDNEGIRLWMLDCGSVAERLREQVAVWQRTAEQAEDIIERIKQANDDMRTWCSPYGFVVRCAEHIDAALAQPDDQHKGP